MSDTVIRVENLSKKYVLAHQQLGGSSSYNSLRDAIATGTKSLAQKLLKPSERKKINPNREEFWALKDVSFEIKQGDRVGIIGRNGAGKSTLLKILSRIVEPTSGSIRIKGRVASLLEVGTGFHPELTGRENIFLNGAILGMSKLEIQRKFDEIVAFAEVEKFLDTPVKRYSSGMYVRLAFAIAAHLEPEILIVDEVLAVGDAQFQKKCLGKMKDIGQEGRTVLFVSHTMKIVEALCSKAILLKTGQVIEIGHVSSVMRTYSNMLGGNAGGEIYHVVSDKLSWKGIANRQDLNTLSHADDLNLVLHFKTHSQKIENFYIDCEIFNERNDDVIHLKSKFVSEGFSVDKYTDFHIEYLIKSPNLAPGNYHMTLYIYTYPDNKEVFWAEKIDVCNVLASSHFNYSEVLDGLKAATIPDFNVVIK